jgi:hypothetical protein
MSGRDSTGHDADNEPAVTSKSRTPIASIRLAQQHVQRAANGAVSRARTSLGLATLLFASACGVPAAVNELGEPLDELPSLDGNDGFGDESGEQDKEREPGRAITGESLSNEAIYAIMRDQAYRGDGFRRINSEPFLSTGSPKKTVVLWVSEAGYAEFRRINADQAGSDAVLPVGTVIIREVYAGSQLDTVTAMVKFPEGTFPLGGDFWYGAADPDGTIRESASDGTPLAGMLENCGTCHLRRDRDAFIFGAPDGYADL